MIISNEQKKAAEQITSATTIVGVGTTINGNIETTGNIRVEGVVLGNVSSKAKVAIGNGSKIQGSIRAQHADIEGEVRGNIEITELLTLKKTAVINGDIVANKLVIELGAFFNGKCVMGAATRNLKVADAGSGFFSLSEATRKL
jgi:cytoskeletal protein CcmA (bactofilin family)